MELWPYLSGKHMLWALYFKNTISLTVCFIVEDGHDANEKYEDLEGQGAIHAAAAVGSLPIVHALIQVRLLEL